jgi:hypothetical protein
MLQPVSCNLFVSADCPTAQRCHDKLPLSTGKQSHRMALAESAPCLKRLVDSDRMLAMVYLGMCLTSAVPHPANTPRQE